MTLRDPGPDSGHERRALMRYVVIAGVVMFVLLVGYFLAYGPLDPQEAANRSVAPNVELENEAAPPKQPATP